MKAKEFFKSNAFKSLAVLLVIVIIAGALLAVFNDLLYVSDTEKENRIYSKIYGETVETENVPFDAEQGEFADGKVEKAVKVKKDGNYLVKATGNNAFGGGTVTVWVVIEMKEGKLDGVGKVVFDSTTVSKYYETSSDFFKKFNNSDEQVKEGEYFGVSDGIVNPSTGATASARAINNAVNTAIDFVKSVVLGESVGGETYRYEKYINMDKSVITPVVSENKVDYELVVKANGDAVEFKINVTVTDNVITAYKVVKNGSTYGYEDSMPQDFIAEENNYFVGKTLQDVEALLSDDGSLSEAGNTLHTGATFSTQSCIWAAAFATANYWDFLYPIEYGDYMDTVDYTVSGNEVAYVLKTVVNGDAVEFEINVTVTEGVITAYKVVKNGSTYGYEDSMPQDFIAEENNYFVGKTLQEIKALLTDDGALNSAGNALHTGATYSTQSCIWAAVYALANYDAILIRGGEQA